MSQRRTFIRWGITTKFLLFNGLVILALGAILAVVFISFQQMETLTTTMLDRNLARIIENGRASQELTTLFAELVTVIFSDQSEAGAARLQALQQQLRTLGAQHVNAELQALLQQFTQQLSTVLEQADMIKQWAAEFTKTEDDFIFNVEMLEDILSEKIETVSAENTLAFNQLKQLQAMSTGYRSSFLHIVKQVNEFQKAGGQNPTAPAKEPPVFSEIAALLSRMQTVTANNDPEIVKQGQQLITVITRYKESMSQFQQAKHTFLEQLTLAGSTKQQALTALKARDEESMQAAGDIRARIQARVQTSRQFIMLLSGVIGVILLLLSHRAVVTVRPLVALSHAARQIANGEMDIRLPERLAHDEIGALSDAFQAMQTKITEVVREVKRAAQDVALRSREMNVVAEQMSQGASQQAAATEEVSASMEEMAANIRQTAENARFTENMAVTSADDARAGKQSVTEIIQAMEVIAERISMVQEIASQTSMLSLNATIEAAKAQEYGKGFTVVAASVRELAHASRSAADEIRTLVNSCVTLSAQAGEVLQRLVPNSEKTAELVQEINAASQEQAHGVEQVNQAVQQLDIVTQHNAAISEEWASTAEGLTTQADALQDAMAFFTIPERITPAATEDHDLLMALQTLAAKGASEQALGALVKSMLPADLPVSAAPKRRDDDTPPQTPGSSDSLASASGAAIHLHTPNIVGDERDEEFEHY